MILQFLQNSDILPRFKVKVKVEHIMSSESDVLDKLIECLKNLSKEAKGEVSNFKEHNRYLIAIVQFYKNRSCRLLLTMYLHLA